MNSLLKIARRVTEIEGKKKQTDIAQVLEILKIVSGLIKSDYRVLKTLLNLK